VSSKLLGSTLAAGPRQPCAGPRTRCRAGRGGGRYARAPLRQAAPELRRALVEAACDLDDNADGAAEVRPASMNGQCEQRGGILMR
jgi:hypothetical protein